MNFKIEKNVPPPDPSHRGPRIKYPFYDMKVGNAFFVEANGRDLTKLQNSISNCAVRAGYKTGGRFITRQVENGVRCWRIE